MSTPQVLVRPPRAALLWAIARWSALAAVPALLLWLVLAPARALQVLWYVAIPALPATFFLSTVLWRGVCPLATLNEMGNRLGTQRAPSPRTLFALSVGGLVLFHLMVPARHFVFNENGPVLAGTVAVVGGLALMLGARFTVRSAFCNALCPVLPVELLYGQAPLLRLDRGRCGTCTVCTPRGCLDLAERKAVYQLLGPSRHTAGWLATPYGAFFAALPGFIVGYNQVTDGPLSTAALVYATTLGWSLASFLLVGVAVLAFRLPSRSTLPLIAAAAGAIYYWYAGPAITSRLAAGPWLGPSIRVVGIGLVAWWLVRALAQPAADTATPGGNGG
jgi:nitrite reductase (NADH) large subunit